VAESKLRVKLAPSILSADFARLGEQVADATRAGADYIHVDIMDGHFVPNLTIGPMVVKAVRQATRLPLDVHLMIESPERCLRAFAEAGADVLTVHVEAGVHLHRVVHQIRELGEELGRRISAAVSLNPATSLSTLDVILPDVDLVLVMSVNPGFGGQSFIESTLEKIRELRHWITELGLPTQIEVDGGVTVKNAPAIVQAGADILVAGNTVFTSPDYRKTIAELRGASPAGKKGRKGRSMPPP